jgi:Fic family protein
VITFTTPPRFTHTAHLVDLIAESERLAQRVATAPDGDRLRDDALAAAAVATLRLDGSPIRTPPATDDVVFPAATAVSDEEIRPGTWLDAMRSGTDADLDEDADREVQALEYLGARAGLASDDLTESLLTEPLESLSLLHGRLTRGLLDPTRAGVPRRSEQAVHDASVGRIIFFPTEPKDIPRDLALVAGWMASAATREHGLVVAGVLQHELLRIHPYEAANGRLARTAARLVLRARGLDPAGSAAPEVPLAADPIGYYDEVARTIRRRDLSIWLERWGEAVAAGLRRAARDLGALDPDVPERATAFLAGRDRFTIADYRAEVGAGPEETRSELGALLDAGLVERVLGSRGLRFAVPAAAAHLPPA